ncbi:hypothetical protein RCL1_003316 [Eukaryota sp. TZLM3-RCL]
MTLNVRDQLMILCKSQRIESYSETLLVKLKTTSTDINDFVEESLGSRRSDVPIPCSDGKCKVVDVITADVCRVSADSYAVANASNKKSKKYNEFMKFILEHHYPFLNRNKKGVNNLWFALLAEELCFQDSLFLSILQHSVVKS